MSPCARARGGSRRIWTPPSVSSSVCATITTAFCWKARRSTGGGDATAFWPATSCFRPPAVTGCWPSTRTTTACAPLPCSTGYPSRKAYARSCTACTSKNPRASRCRPSPAPCTAISATAWRASSTRSWKTACPKKTPTPALSCREPCSCSTTCTTGCARSASANTGT